MTFIVMSRMLRNGHNWLLHLDLLLHRAYFSVLLLFPADLSSLVDRHCRHRKVWKTRWIIVEGQAADQKSWERLWLLQTICIVFSIIWIDYKTNCSQWGMSVLPPLLSFEKFYCLNIVSVSVSSNFLSTGISSQIGSGGSWIKSSVPVQCWQLFLDRSRYFTTF